MKLTAILLCAVLLHASATGRAQGITLSERQAPLEKVFRAIETQSGFTFFFNYAWLRDARPVTLETSNVSLEEALAAIFREQPFSFEIVGKTIVVRQKESAPGPSTIPTAPGSVHGTVYDERGQPLSGVNVTIKESGKGTITNAKGEFEITRLPEKATLVFSFIGYASQEFRIGKETANIRILMAITKNELDKVVIQAYGTTSRRITTSDIGVVTSAEIEKQPVVNLLQALQGRVAGLDINQTSGYASAPFKVELRGRSAINSNFPSDPLYIIDGVPLTVLEVGGNSGYAQGSMGFLQNGMVGPASGQSPLFSLNPADIESVEVLKDADATAIYGSRGANGVILINTKKGRAGKTKFDIRVQQGAKRVTRFYKLLNTPQYLAMRREAFKNDQVTYGLVPGVTIPDAGNAPDLVEWDTTRYTDWQRTLFGHASKYTDAQASLSGGDDRTTFRIAAGYRDQGAFMVVNGSDQQGSLSFNIVHKSLDQRFSVSMSADYSLSESSLISLPGQITLPPDTPPIFDSAGNLNWNGWGSARDAYPFAAVKQPYSAKTNFLNSNLTVRFQPFKGLTLGTSLGYNNAQANQQSFEPIASQDPQNAPTGTANFGKNSNINWVAEPQISYDGWIGKGKLEVLGGASIQQTSTEGLAVQGTGYTTDELLRTISNAPRKFASDNYADYRYAAVFGRLTYNWKNKYILNLNARRDGSSRFGPGNLFGNFGSVGAAWIFTEEGWARRYLSFLSFGKFRGSYGTTGSDQVGLYQYITRWSSSGLHPYNNIEPLAPTQHANPNFHWQVNKKLEGAIDLGFLKDRITVNIAYYRDRCGNQLIQLPTPGFSGFGNVTANWPALVQNQGWESTVNAKIIATKDFTWSASFVTGMNRNKLLAYPNLALSQYAGSLVIGQPLNITRLLHYIGVDPQTGQYAYQDKNHDGVISTDPGITDDRYVVNLNPSFLGGLGMNVEYKALQLTVYFNIKKQIGVNAIAQGAGPGNESNQPIESLARWQKPGDISPVALFTTQGNTNAGYFGGSDGGYTDASFIRMSNLSLAYNLPAAYVKKMGLQACSLFLEGENLFVITKYKGLDPETQDFGGLPPAKVFTGGLSLSF